MDSDGKKAGVVRAPGGLSQRNSYCCDPFLTVGVRCGMLRTTIVIDTEPRLYRRDMLTIWLRQAS
jgi:hypothetical protein